MPEPDNKWLEDLRQAYLRKLPAKVGTLERLLSEWKTQHDPVALQQIIAVLHRIHGTAGTYSLDEIGTLAGDCEDRVKASPHDQAEAILDDCVSRMNRALEKIQKPG